MPLLPLLTFSFGLLPIQFFLSIITIQAIRQVILLLLLLSVKGQGLLATIYVFKPIIHFTLLSIFSTFLHPLEFSFIFALPFTVKASEAKEFLLLLFFSN